MIPSREIFWNISFGNIVYFLTAILLVFLVFEFYKHYRIWKMGREENRLDHIWERFKGVLIYGIIQKRIYSDKYAGITHLLIFSGIIIMAVGSGILALEHFGIKISGDFYLAFSFILDIFGLGAMIGIILALWRRCVIKPEKIKTEPEDLFLLCFLLAVLATGFLVEAARIAFDFPGFEVWSPVGWQIALLLSGLAKAQIIFIHKAVWWLHMGLAFALMGYFVYSKLFHAVLAPLNIFFRSLKHPGALEPLEFKKGVKNFGIGTRQDLFWKDLLDLDACTQCGACEEVCPAALSKKSLSPKRIICRMKDSSFAEPAQEFSEAISREEIWACATCGFCQKRCPVFAEHHRKIIGLRRYSFLTKNKYPKELMNIIKSIRTNNNPYGAGKGTRADWRDQDFPKILSSQDEVEILLWVGCAGAFDERVKRVARSLADVLRDSGVTFGILGSEEKCCGQWLRGLGDEMDFQKLAKENLKTLKNYKFRKIVTFCPHCFQTLKNEYPDFGGNFEVLHHSQLLERLVKEGRIKFSPSAEKAASVTYHDPCYLGRYNDIYEPPRNILKSLGFKIKEMPLAREKSLCCGAGGGRNWLEENPETRVNRLRAKQAEEIKADMAITSCPFCLGMFEEGLDGKINVFDIVEILDSH